MNWECYLIFTFFLDCLRLTNGIFRTLKYWQNVDSLKKTQHCQFIGSSNSLSVQFNIEPNYILVHPKSVNLFKYFKDWVDYIFRHLVPLGYLRTYFSLSPYFRIESISSCKIRKNSGFIKKNCWNKLHLRNDYI